MKILIDIGHPAHVHLFKHFAWQMQKNGYKIFFTCREKEFEIYLLEKYGFKYKSFGKKYSSKLGKIWGLFEFDIKEYIAGLMFRPDLFLSHGSIYAAHAAFLMGKPHISMEDTGNMEQVKLYRPFTKYILTSSSFQNNLGKKQIRYNAFHEIAYLHPKYFIPDSYIFEELGLGKNEKFCLIRFIGWNATHDINVKGLDLENKIEIVYKLLKYCKVFISSEGAIPKEIEQYRIKIKPERIHHVMAYASLLFGESGTMTSECAVLGTPAIQISGLPKGTMGVLAEQEKYGLVKIYEKYSKDVLEEAVKFVVEDRKNESMKRRDKMLSEKTDLTQYLIDFVTNLNEYNG